MDERKGAVKGAPGKKTSPNAFIFKGLDPSVVGQLILLFAYLVLMLILGLVLPVAFQFIDYFGESKKLLIYTAGSGCLGGTVYCMWSYSKHIANSDFDPRFIPWYLFRPLVSAVLGIFSYYLIYSGLMATSFTVPSSSTTEFSKIFFCSIAFIAGFSVDEFVEKLRNIAKALFTDQGKKWETSKKKKP